MLATVEQVKRVLDIPEADTQDNEYIVWLVDQANRRVLDQSRLSLAAEVGRIDTFHEVQVGRRIRLSRRPVTQVTAAEIRTLGSDSEFSSVTFDLADAKRGLVILLGGFGLDVWPPREPPSLAFSWRDPIWPVVRITYDTGALAAGSEDEVRLRGAAASLAAYWYERFRAASKASESIGPFRQTFMEAAIPPWVQSQIEQVADRGGSADWVA